MAAWGFGVLPGSGVASLEEMLGAGQNRAAMEAQAEAGGGGGGRQERETRESLLQRCLAASEELRQLRGISEEEAREKMAKYLHDQLGVISAYDEEAGTIDWAKVKDGQIALLTNSLVDGIQKVRAEGLDV
jgi:glucose-6-phosphate-specific signal transduction histidine kinase